MSAPNVLSVEPADSATDVILGTVIFVTFDQEIDATTVTDATFSLTGPGQVERVTSTSSSLNSLSNGREYITGQFSFIVNSNGQSVLTFTPDRTLRKNTTYDVLILGSSGSLVSGSVKNPAGEAMVNTYQWSFTTGNLDIAVPPPLAPLPPTVVPLDPSTIRVDVGASRVVGNDLTQPITLTFPTNIDPATDLYPVSSSSAKQQPTRARAGTKAAEKSYAEAAAQSCAKRRIRAPYARGQKQRLEGRSDSAGSDSSCCGKRRGMEETGWLAGLTFSWRRRPTALENR